MKQMTLTLCLILMSTLIAIPISQILANESEPDDDDLPAPSADIEAVKHPVMKWGDETRRGVPFSKDPSVVRFKGRYLMYFSLPSLPDDTGMNGWSVGIAESDDLVNWKKVGEILPSQECDKRGLAAPCAKVWDGRVHLFYQTYGNREKDALCHAVSDDGLKFTPHPQNPIFHPTGDWNVGRAIDADAFKFNGKVFLYFATRDPEMKIQMQGVASCDEDSDFGPDTWTQLGDGPILKPELDWETRCIEAATLCRRGDTLVMFYAGGYNNDPQQVGVATSTDGVKWTRRWDVPLITNGGPDDWNYSESGHPGVFVDDDGQTYLFYQGNPDRGKSWCLTRVRIGWKNDTTPYVMEEDE